jgi:hypothetical protein
MGPAPLAGGPGMRGGRPGMGPAPLGKEAVPSKGSGKGTAAKPGTAKTYVNSLFEDIISSLGTKGIYVPKQEKSYIANTIAMQANDANSVKKDVYEKVGDRVANGLWTQAKITEKRLENETEKFASQGRGALAGYKFELDNGVDLSPFVRWDKVDMNQEGKGEIDRGVVNNFGVGFVEELNSDKTFIKIAAMYTRGVIGTERKEKGSTVSGETSVGTSLLGVKTGSNLWLLEEGIGQGLKMAPYIGATVINVNRDGYNETGDKNALEIQKSNMNRISLDLGLGVEGKVNRKLSWNAGIGADIIIRGSKQEVFAKGEASDFYGDSDLIGTKYVNEVPIVSKNIEEGKVRIGGNIGADYKLNKDVKVEANIGVEKGSNYGEVKGNIGLGMKIGKGRDVKAELRAMGRAKERMLLKAKEGVADKKESIGNTFKKKLKENKKKLVKNKKELIKKIKEENGQVEKL